MKRSSRDLFDKRDRFSIRRLSVGAASVLIGCLLFGTQVAHAEAAIDTATSEATSGSAAEEPTQENTATATREVEVEAPSSDPVVHEETVPAKTGEAEDERISVETTPVNEELGQPPVLDAARLEEPIPTADVDLLAASTDLYSVEERSVPSSHPSLTEEASHQVNAPETWNKITHITDTDRSIHFDNDWKFQLGAQHTAAQKDYDDSSWQSLDLPHDFSLTQDYTPSGEAESGYKLGGTGWYRKNFTVGPEVANGRVELHFDGAYMETEVFINGTSLGTHTNGYSPFTFDLTGHVRANEENTLAVKVVNNTPSSRWYSGSGIYRSVQLNVTPKVHLAEYGVVVKTPNLKDSQSQNQPASIEVATSINNVSSETAQVKVKTTLFERNADGSLGTEVAQATSAVQALAANTSGSLSTNLRLVNPKLWSVDNPSLYIVRTEVFDGETKLQTREQETGFRYIEFDKDTGFKLNGQKMKLQGVSMHHDQGGLGARAYYDAIERQVEILKEMGVNAIRVTHNPAARALKDIANRKGVLLIDEAFDTWEHAKNGNTNDYARFFNRPIGQIADKLVGANPSQTWAEFHIKQMVKSGINDPAIIMWSTGNEVLEGIGRNASNYGRVIKKLIDWVGEVDTSRPATLGDNLLKRDNATSIAMATHLTAAATKGIVGFNYANGSQYDAARQAHPNWIIYGSETASSVNSRGVYTTKGNNNSPDKQRTAYDQSKVGWGHYASEAWYDTIVRDFVAGEFVWTGFDYLGEPTPWNDTGAGSRHGWPAPKSSYFGIVDTAGFPKDSYYFYRSQWNKKDTTLHVLPAWEESVVSKNAQNQVEVVVYSNAAKVKLVHVGTDGQETDLGTKEFTKLRTDAGFEYQIYQGQGRSAEEHKNLYLTWHVDYRPGSIKAIAYDSNGHEISDTVGRKEVKTFGTASKLKASIGKQPRVTSDQSLAYIEIDVQDAAGNLVANATNPVSITVEGPAVLVAMDNGNAMDHQSYQASSRKAFAGKVLAIVKLDGTSGQVRVTASSAGLTPSTVAFTANELAQAGNKQATDLKFTKTIYIKRGATLSLPTTARVRYSDKTEEDKQLTFDRAQVDSVLAAGTSFVARGDVAGLATPVEILVSVIDQVATMKNISTAIEVGSQPSLPEKVQAFLADGRLLSSEFPVTWTRPVAGSYDREGIVLVPGKANVLGTEMPVTASVRVGRKTLTVDQNVAPSAASLVQDLAPSQQSGSLNAIKDGVLAPTTHTGHGENPTIWSNYRASQAGKNTAKLTFTYDTAQNIGEVVAYYHRDNRSARPPKSVAFEWARSNTDQAEGIEATEIDRSTTGSVTKVTYRLANPVPAVVFSMVVENADQVVNMPIKPSVSLVELELKTVLEQFVQESDPSINHIRFGANTYTDQAISKTMTISGNGELTARHTSHNPAITILKIDEETYKIFSEAEDKSRSEVYTLTVVAESPKTEGRNYIPIQEMLLTAGSTQPGPANALSNLKDINVDSYWHSSWKGTFLNNLWVTVDTGKERQLNGLAYMHRRDDSPNGKVTDYEVYVSGDNQNWTSVKTGRFEENNREWQEVSFEPTVGRYVKLQAVHTLGDGNRPDRFMSASEIRVSEFVSGTEAEPTSPQAGDTSSTNQPTSPQTGNTESSNQPTTPTPPPVLESGDGTVETAAGFRATKPASAEAIAAAKTSSDYLRKEYTIFPSPQSVTYGTGTVALQGTVNLVIGDGVDIYTRNRLKDTLQANQISYTTSHAAVADATNVYIGIQGKASAASNHQASSAISQDLYSKIDAYSLVIKDNAISVVGRDTDAVFYGLTTLKHMLNESPVPVLREVKVEDYADIKNRGFIEGYYGNPWSNEDRMELMRYGGDIKLTQYFFAPKDDEYHNSRWRDLYPESKLAEIREMARVGNQNKTRYVWTLHPFMNDRVRFGNDAHYQEDLGIIKAKFTQLMGAGVREFGILADDAPNPVGGFESYNRLMTDLTTWLESKQAEYPGLRKEMVFVPHEYWGDGDEAELRSLNENLPATSTLTLTGGRIWGEVSSNFLNRLKTNLESGGNTYRPVQLWINWPCTDNSKEHLILGGGEKFLHPNVDPSLIGGIMLNPMQQSEPSKLALFSAAEYTWNIWKSEEEARRVNDIGFNFIETGRFTETPASRAFRELGKHMINQNMDKRVVKLEESLELAPKLTTFTNKLAAGEPLTTERAALRAEFATLKQAAETYKASGNERMKGQISYWLDNTIDQMNALDALLTATEHIGGDSAALWNNYYRGLSLYEQSKTHTFWYVSRYEKAELGVQHIRPFILHLLERLASEIEKDLYPNKISSTFISNRTGAEGRTDYLTDGDLSTQLIFKNPNAIRTGDYVGLEFNKPVQVTSLGFAMGTLTNPLDTFETAVIEYLDEAGQWQILEGHGFVGNEPLIQLSDLAVTAKAVRMRASSDRSNAWFAVREIAVNRPLATRQASPVTVTHSPNLVYKLNTTAGQITDQNEATEAMLANSSGADNTPVDAWVQLDLGVEKPISKVRLVQGSRDKLSSGVLEYSLDGDSWTELARLTGDQTKEVTQDITARYIRARNKRPVNIWWRIKDFQIEVNEGTKELTDTNVKDLATSRTFTSLGSYDLHLPSEAQLAPNQYIGLKLDRLHELETIGATGSNLELKYSPNLVEWYSAQELAEQPLARYIRLTNTSKETQAIGTSHLLVRTKEIHPDKLKSTSLPIHPVYGSSDVRNRKNLDQLFDGVYNNTVEFSNTPTKDGHILLEFGLPRPIHKIRAYIQDGTTNYLRDGKIQVSPDGESWTDVVTVGDGIANVQKDDSLGDGWTHDSAKPGNRYIEGSLASPVQAKYLRVLFTANYAHRFVSFTELVINDGEYVATVNDPTVQGQATENHTSKRNYLVDGKVLTAYTATAAEGHLLYHLSEDTAVNHIKLISELPEGATASLSARVVKAGPSSRSSQVPTEWIDLGPVTSNYQTFVVREPLAHLLDVKIEWAGGPITVYELSTYHAPVVAESVEEDKPSSTPERPQSAPTADATSLSPTVGSPVVSQPTAPVPVSPVVSQPIASVPVSPVVSQPIASVPVSPVVSQPTAPVTVSTLVSQPTSSEVGVSDVIQTNSSVGSDSSLLPIETAKTEPAYHEIPNLDIEAWLEGLIKENDQSTDLVTAKGEALVHILPAFDGGLVPNEAPITEELPIIEPTSLVKQAPLASQTSQTTSKAEKALPATGDTHSDLALVGLTVLGLLGTAVRKRKG
ncbi:TPA: beta-N-acetylglucosaminidase domain-containing protein [Streptococcus suis]